MTVRSPMMAGPEMTLLMTLQPGWRTTRPWSLLSSSTSPPDLSAGSGSRTERVADKRGACPAGSLAPSPAGPIGGKRLEDDAVRRQEVVVPAGVDPLTLDDLGADVVAMIQQPLNRVGDLELAAGGRLDAGDRFEDARREHVDAYDGEGGRGVFGLFDDLHQAFALELGDTELAGVGDLLKHDAGVVAGSGEGVDVGDDAVREEVVAEEGHKRGGFHGFPGDADGLGDAAGLELVEVGDLGTEAGAVAGFAADLVAGFGRHDDGDIGDAGLDEVLDDVEEDGLVGDGDHLLGARVGERTQAGALSPPQIS